MDVNTAGMQERSPPRVYTERKEPTILLHSCCCGCTLGQGTVGAGIYSMVQAFVFFSLGIFILGSKGEFNSFDDTKPKGTKSDEDSRVVVGVMLVVEAVVVIFCSICLFFAVQMKRRSLLCPWLAVKGISLTLNIVATILSLIKGYKIRTLGGSVAVMILMLYLYVVVLSCYQSDMGRFLGDRIQDPSELQEPGFLPTSQPLYSNSVPPSCPLILPASTYPFPPPTTAFNPSPQGAPAYNSTLQGAPTDPLAPLYPPMYNPAIPPYNSTNPSEQPPPYSAVINETDKQRDPSPKRY